MQSRQDLILNYSIAYLHIGQKDSIFQIGRSWLILFACLDTAERISFFGNYYKYS